MSRKIIVSLALVLCVTLGLQAQKPDTSLDPVLVKGWPTGKIPKEVPPYTGGTITNSGGDTSTYFIKVDKTSPAQLSTYLKKLSTEGWIVTEGSFPKAQKALLKLEFTWQKSDYLQIALYQSVLGSWPAGQIPPELVPPAKARFAGPVSINVNEAGRSWFISFRCLGMDETAAKSWLQSLLSQGWEGGETQISRSFKWKDRPMSASLDLMDSDKESSSFTYNYSFDD